MVVRMSSETLHPAIAAIARAATGITAPTSDHVTRAEQADLLQRILDRSGRAGLLLAGRHVDVVASEPIVLVLLNSDGPGVLLDKIHSLNRYLHSTHRHVVHQLTDTSVDLEHRSNTGDPPSPEESIFVCGLYLALLDRIGCTDLTCTFPDSGSPDAAVYSEGVAWQVPSAGTGRWRIGWSSVHPTRVLTGLDEVLLSATPPDLTNRSVADRVAAVIRSDLTRTWKLADAAALLATSERTLQRRLRSAGTTFTTTVESTRIAAAKELLRDSASSITDIGYLIGYADTAHFSRSFKRATGAAPSVWRSGDRASSC